jgi:hypothetical protein
LLDIGHLLHDLGIWGWWRNVVWVSRSS